MKILRFFLWGALLLFLCGVLTAAENDQAGSGARGGRKFYAAKKKERPWWYALEEGKKAFREGDYGRALSYFEDARDTRKKFWERHKKAFVALMTIPEVRRYGDALDRAEKYAEEHSHDEAKLALETLYFNAAPGVLNNSVKAALNCFDLLKACPEAGFWIGEVYRMEGENEIALRQYGKALEGAGPEDAAQRRNILYRIAGTNREMQRYNDMEAAYNEILKSDALWNDSENFIRNSMLKTLETDGINTFLIRFRHKNPDTDKAHRELGHFYYMTGRYNLAQIQLMFACLIESTIIIEEVKRGKYDFVFTTLDDLMAELERKKEVRRYIEDSGYFKNLYYLAAALYANGKISPANEIWRFVSAQGEDGAGEWANRSRNQMRSPFMEKLIEMP